MDALFSQLFSTRGRKILGIGKNYLAHAIEMGGAAVPDKPLVFLKPVSSIVGEGIPLILPNTEVHHEVELGVMIGRGGKNISVENAMGHVGGYFLALDMTARELQAEAKTKGFPWSIAKGMDHFCPISKFVPVDQVPDPHNLGLELKINGLTVQTGNTGEMHFKIPFLISFLSEFMTLDEGDLILTGTPEGVGPVNRGDHLDVFCYQGENILVSATWDVAS
jgi:acylpyruvate hydrolase